MSFSKSLDFPATDLSCKFIYDEPAAKSLTECISEEFIGSKQFSIQNFLNFVEVTTENIYGQL